MTPGKSFEAARAGGEGSQFGAQRFPDEVNDER